MFSLRDVRNGSEIIIPAGVHTIIEPIVIKGKNIRIRGEDGAVLRGTVKMRREDFCETEPGVWSAPAEYEADAFYIGSRKYRMARYPKYTDPDEVFGGYAADCIFPEKTKKWADPAGGYIHAMHRCDWGGYSYRIDGKNDDGSLILSGGWQNNRQMGMHEQYRYAENIREEMTEEGEWYFDRAAMRVYVRPVPGDDLGDAEIAVSRGFFILEGCENVSIENITFERSVRTFMDTKEPLLRSDWTIYRGGAVLVKDSAGCTIDRCVFRDIGSNGVFTDGNCSGIRITRTHFSHIGASGLCFVGRADCVRNPLFEYNETQSLADISTEKGPKSDNYPKNCTVEDCLIEHVGTVEKQATGVEISMAYGIAVKNCTVCHTSRAGINISEGTFGGHRIEGCDVFDTVRETGDHGSFNSWGRDRYWHLRDLDDREAGKYALLDMLAPNVITRSRFRCDKGWDIDLDDGSSWFTITGNLCLNGGIKLREGFFRTVKNNITVNNGMHFHVWYPESGDTVENNILFSGYSIYALPEKWGKSVDGNYLVKSGQTEPVHASELSEQSKQDAASVCIDPAFASPADSDYRPMSPYVEGFENFPTEFGVRYEPLRKIADSPVLPAVISAKREEGRQVTEFCYMKVKNIDTDGEMSVYGTAGHSGVLVLAVDEDSDAYRRGIRADDVIVALGEREIGNTDDLRELTVDGNTPIQVIRGQNRIEI